MTITVRKLYIILAVALSISAITIGVVIVWTNLSNHHLRHSNSTSEREINDNEPSDNNSNNGIGFNIHFPNPLRMLASSLSSERVLATTTPAPIELPRFIERHMYVVDMLECDKTFAAMKYKLWVRVPEKTPPFKQRPNPNILPMSQQQHRQRRPSGYLTSQQWQQNHNLPLNNTTSMTDNLASNRSPRSMDSGSGNNPQAEPETTATSHDEAAPSDEQNKSTIRRILEALLERRQRRVEQIEDTDSNESTNSHKTIEEQDTTTTTSHQLVDHSMDIVGGSSSHEDPIELAASELDLMAEEANPSAHLKATILNRTLVDCFMVDTEKRFQQKIDIEHRYRHIVSTRQVDANLMNSAIDRCTNLVELMSPDKITIVKLNDSSSTNTAANQVPIVNSTHSSGFSFNPFQPIANSGFFESILASALAPIEQQQQHLQQHDQQMAANSNSNQVSTVVNSPDQVNEKQLANSRIIGSNNNTTTTNNNGNQTATRGLSNYVSAGVSMINGIVPNTLWCGLGDRASNYSELGTEYRVDACCRAHDHCPVRLRPFTNDYGLMNWSVSTRSHCSCDLQFNLCLARVNSTLANVIRVIYFRFVGLQCIEFNNNHNNLLRNEATQASDIAPAEVRQAASPSTSLLSTATGFVFG